MMAQIKSAIGKFMRDEEGASAIEYALIVAMVALVVALFSGDIGGKITTILQSIDTALTPDAG